MSTTVITLLGVAVLLWGLGRVIFSKKEHFWSPLLYKLLATRHVNSDTIRCRTRSLQALKEDTPETCTGGDCADHGHYSPAWHLWRSQA